MSNDNDIDGDGLSVTSFVVSGDASTHAAGSSAVIAGVGLLTINGDGSYSFVPLLNYTGSVPVVTYTVSDGALSDTATLSIAVSGVNDAPVADDETFTIAEDTSTGSLDLLVGDVDVDGDGLSLQSINGTVITPGSAQAIAVGNGVVNVSGVGVVTFTPDANYNGAITFDYVVSDGNGGSDIGTVNGTVSGVNDAPVGIADIGTTSEDASLTVAAASGLLSNDNDIDGDGLSVTSFVVSGDASTHAAGSSAVIAGVGLLTINGDGSYSFVPLLNYTGSVPVVTYTVSDGALSDTATLSIAVSGVNDAPVGIADIGTTSEDASLTVAAASGLLSNDNDIDGDGLSVTSFVVSGDASTHAAGSSAVIAGVGLLTINGDGSYSFVPLLNYTGSVPVVTYTVSDGALSDTATLSIAVSGVNDAPVADDETFTIAEDTSTGSLDLLVGDVDVDGDGLSLQSINGTVITPGSAQAIAVGNGVVNVSGVGVVTFTPDANYNGAITFDYVVSDGNGGSDIGTVNGTVSGVNDAPVGIADIGTTSEDASLTVAAASGLLSNDNDIDGDGLSVTSFVVSGDASTHAAGSSAVIAGVGLLTINGDGSYSFVPLLNYTGSVPVVTYTVSDGALSDTATLSIAVSGVNDAPVADDETFTIAEDTSTGSLDLLVGDVDVDGDGLSLQSINGTVITPGSAQAIAVGNGVVNVSGVGVVTFTPDANYNGAITFDYVVSDGNGGSDIGTVNGTVSGVNDAPVGIADIGTTSEDASLTVAAASGLLSNDNDIDGDGLSVTSFVVSGDASTHAAGSSAVIAGVGLLTINGDGSYSFVPLLNYTGSVPVVTYTVSDGALSDTATLSIAVSGVNDAPVADDETFTIAEDTSTGSLDLLVGDVDVDGDGLSLQSINGTVITPGSAQAIAVGNGVVNVSGVGVVTFTPDANYNGAITFDYVVSDGNGGSDIGTVNGNGQWC